MLTLQLALATEVAARFGIGSPRHSPRLTAAGWAAHSLLWRFDTTEGSWALKEIGREPASQIENAADIESAARRTGIACPLPVPALDGPWTVTIDGRSFRCHEWVTGACPTTTLTAEDAWQAGHALGNIHQLNLPWDPAAVTPRVWGEAHWRALIGAGEGLGKRWSAQLENALTQIAAMERAAAEWAARRHRWIGSHNDVRPDNALRCCDGTLLLVDWDAAGPTVPGRELASVLRWWAPHQDALLAGYEAAAGPPDLNESAGENGSLLWWLNSTYASRSTSPTTRNVKRQRLRSSPICSRPPTRSHDGRRQRPGSVHRELRAPLRRTWTPQGPQRAP